MESEVVGTTEVPESITDEALQSEGTEISESAHSQVSTEQPDPISTVAGKRKLSLVTQIIDSRCC